ncbi:MAG: Gfo/Idh/MocA family oxidoreductase, partial [candidate division KSB1 bacterium]|nr:Gfo/Idh/MocA family oxidoreductase [candidate division KSB1 bacterium]
AESYIFVNVRHWAGSVQERRCISLSDGSGSRREVFGGVDYKLLVLFPGPGTSGGIAMTDRPLRIAQLGVGNWGKNVLRNLLGLPGVEVPVVADIDPALRAATARQYPTLRVVESVDAVLSEPGLDAVVIATPPRTHYELALKALTEGKNVFVEKPLTLSASDAEVLVREAEARGLVLMVGHILEYHPAFLRMKEMIDAGELGDLLYAYSTRVNLGVVRRDENALWSFAPHDVSVILWFFGEAPSRVQCTGQAYLQPGIEDVAFLSLAFPSGRLAHIHVSWLDPHKIRRLTLVGSRKMAVLDDMEAMEKIRVYDKGVGKGTYLGYGEDLSLRFGDIWAPYVQMREPLRAELEHFVQCIRTGERPRSDGRDGLRVVRVLEGAQRSLKRGGEPVSLD